MPLMDDGDLFTAKPVQLSQLLNGIHQGTTVLPNFQRPMVWGPERVRELIISVAFSYPAGSLLTMPVSTKAFELRQFEGAPVDPSVRPNLMVLDGQQRLTSLYQACYRTGGVSYQGRLWTFYLDIKELLSDEDGNIAVGDPHFDRALFYVVTEKRDGRKFRYRGLEKQYELTTREDELNAGAMPLGIMFDSNEQLSSWQRDYLLSRSGNDMQTYVELNTKWDRLVKSWLDRIRSYRFPVVELRGDMPLGAICFIFEKVNSTGVPLDVFDLCTAIFWSHGFKLNEEWKKTQSDFHSAHILPMQPLHGTMWLQALSLLESVDRKRANVKPEVRIAVTCRKEDLMNMNVASVKELWQKLVAGYKEASKFMTDKGILSARILPYTTMIVPLSAIFADLLRRKGEAPTKAAWPKIERWYWCSVFGGRYSGPVETNAAQDFEQVISWIEGGPEPDAVRMFSFRADYLQEITSVRNAAYKGVLCLLAKGGAEDFGGGGKLTTDLVYEEAVDHHHIFPLKALERLGIKDPRANSIVNKTLISAAANRSIGGQNPSDYMSILGRKLGSEKRIKDILGTHMIDPDKLSANDWTGFISERRNKLRTLVEEACGGGVLPFSDRTEQLVMEETEPEEERSAIQESLLQ